MKQPFSVVALTKCNALIDATTVPIDFGLSFQHKCIANKHQIVYFSLTVMYSLHTKSAR